MTALDLINELKSFGPDSEIEMVSSGCMSVTTIETKTGGLVVTKTRCIQLPVWNGETK